MMRSAYLNVALLLALLEGVSSSPLFESRGGPSTYFINVANPAGSGEYLAKLNIDGKDYHVNFDTGSPDLWVKGTPPPGAAPFDTKYAVGEAAGGIVKGGRVILSDGFEVKGDYGLATKADSFDAWDGIMGLQPGKTFKGDTPTILEQIKPLLKDPVFTIDIQADDGSHGNSVFNFGDINYLNGAGTPIPLDGQYVGWHLKANGFNAPKDSDKPSLCNLDTGTTNLYVPQSVAVWYWSQVPGAQSSDSKSWTVPCDAKPPDFVPVLAGQNYTISGTDTWFNSGAGGNNCVSRLQASDNDECIMGQTFFYGRTTMFNFDKSTVTFGAPRGVINGQTGTEVENSGENQPNPHNGPS